MSDNIHVAIRIRPLIKREIENNASVYWQTKDSSIIYQKTCPTSMYCFDRVFDMNEGNALIYQDLCAPIVQSVMQGFNGTIFAYGQTSSGKTFTMSGDNGIIPNAIHDIFNAIDNMPEREFLLRVSYMEIYNENVIDLLCGDSKNLKTMEDIDGVLCVVGLVEQEIKTSEEVFRIMKRGERKRRVGDTQMNEKSSRSHSIFRMIIESRMRNTNTDDSVVNVGQLNLVDLAGSEKSGQMGITGDRFREGININKSLFMLTHVISQLSKGGEKQYVNYRDSKLTRILQNSLGGNARTVIICTVTPASVQETHSTLKFASRAKQIKNKPTANMISNEKALLKRYTNEIRSLSEKLEALQQQGDDGKKEILEKELEEKNKQNERLKQQIQELKEKFVVSQLTADRSDIILNKKLRRETWCGGIVGRKQSSCQMEVGPLTSRLPILQEDQALNSSLYSGDLFEFDFVCHNRKSSNLSPNLYDFQNSFYKVGVDAAIQTDFSCMKKEKELIRMLRHTMDNLNKSREEYEELKEFTAYEKSLLEGNMPTDEIEELKARNQDLEVKVAEYDVLLQENSKQRNRIQDLLNQIKKLEEEIYSYKMAEHCQNTNLNGSYDCGMGNMKPVNVVKPNLLQEIQASEAKEFLNMSIQVNELEACVETLERSMQTEILHYVDEKAVQAGSVTPCVETTTQVGSPWIKKQKSGSENQSISSLASPVQKMQQSIPAMPFHHLVSSDDMKAVKESIMQLFSECTTISDTFSSTYNDMKITMNSIEEDLLEADIFIEEKEVNLSELVEKTFRLKYEQTVQDLEYKLKMKETDCDSQSQEIERLGNVCNFKDNELRTISENVDHLKKKIQENEAELITWREKASEKYDLYLNMLKEKEALLIELKEIKAAMTEKERNWDDVIANAKLNEKEIGRLKNELTENMKLLEMSKTELSMERESSETKVYLCESNCDRLNKELSLLKQKLESCAQIYEEKLEELKTKSEEKIAALEKDIKRDCDEKLNSLQKDLDNQHLKELNEIRMKYEQQIRSDSHAFKLEKLKFEEQLYKSNSDFIKKASDSISELKQQLSAKETECVKLRTSLQDLASKKTGNSQGNEYASKLSVELEEKRKELKNCQEIIIDLQKKFQCAQKTLTDLETSKNAKFDNYFKLEKEKKALENLLKERDSAIKDHGLKFSAFKVEFEKEFKKLKTERDTLIKQVQKLEKDVEAKENKNNIQSEVDKNPLPVNILKAKENTAEQNLAYVEMEYEFKRTQQRCKKLEQEREILMQKLSLCKNEIRRLNEPNNESKVEAKPQLSTHPVSSNATNSANSVHLESMLNFKEKRIKRLEKEIQKYKDYLKSKGHHKIVEEATKEAVKVENSSKQAAVSSTPSSITTASSAPAINITPVDHSLPDNKNIALSKAGIIQKIPGAKFGSVEKPKSTISNLKKEEETCKQQ